MSTMKSINLLQLSRKFNILSSCDNSTSVKNFENYPYHRGRTQVVCKQQRHLDVSRSHHTQSHIFLLHTLQLFQHWAHHLSNSLWRERLCSHRRYTVSHFLGSKELVRRDQYVMVVASQNSKVQAASSHSDTATPGHVQACTYRQLQGASNVVCDCICFLFEAKPTCL